VLHQLSGCGDASRGRAGDGGATAALLALPARADARPSILDCLVEHKPGAFRANKGCSAGHAWEPSLSLGENCPQPFLVKSGASCAGWPPLLSRGELRYSGSSVMGFLTDAGRGTKEI